MANHRSVEKERFWRGVVEGHVGSGLSIRDYCRQQNVSEPSFYVWRQRLQPDRSGKAVSVANRRRRSKKHGEAGFIPVAITAGRQVGIEIETPAGIVIRLREYVSPETLQRVIGAVGNGPSSC
jgi:transposase